MLGLFIAKHETSTWFFWLVSVALALDYFFKDVSIVKSLGRQG